MTSHFCEMPNENYLAIPLFRFQTNQNQYSLLYCAMKTIVDGMSKMMIGLCSDGSTVHMDSDSLTLFKWP